MLTVRIQSFHLPDRNPLDLAPSRYGGLPQCHRAIPSAALDELFM